MTTFDEHICAPIRSHLGRPIRLPAVGTWDVGTEGGAPTLSLDLPRAVFGENLQTNRPAAPFFLLCFAWWHARLTGTDPGLRIRLVGEAPTATSAMRHDQPGADRDRSAP